MDSETNKVGYWCEDGFKYEPVDTPFIVPAPPEGATWTLIVLKGGTTNETHLLPLAGDEFSHSQHENSHVILCYETLVITTTTEGSTTTTTVLDTTTTTTTSTPTTTVIDTTTTAPETTTTSSSIPTTTTEPRTTSTVISSSTTTSQPTTTSSSSTTTTVPLTTTTVTTSTLPVTGFEVSDVAPLAILLVGVGLLLLSLASWAVRASGSPNE